MKVLQTISCEKGQFRSSIHDFLDMLFSCLDDKGILYCVLRNYEGLPDHIENDIDLHVHQKHVKLVRQCLLSTAKHSGWVLIKNPSRFAWQGVCLKNVLIHKFVQIDINSSFYWKGVALSSTDRLLKNRIRLRQFFIPEPVVEAGTLLIKDVIQTGKIKAKYLEKIFEAAKNDQLGFQDFLEWSLGSFIAGWLYHKVQRQAWQEIEQSKNKIRLAIIGRAFCRNPLGSLLNFIRFLWGHLCARLAKPAGMFVVLFGPDGSGKSAVAERLQETLKLAFRHRQYYHGRFGVLPRLRAFRDVIFRAIGKPVQVQSDEMVQYHNEYKHSLVRVLIHIIYYSLDYLLGHLVVRRSQAMGDLIIFDRYFYDWFIQSYFQRIPRWILPVLKFVYPRPDLVIYLRNSSEVIHRRKPELTIEQIEQQSRRCQEVMQDLPYGITVTTDSSLQEITQQVSEKIVQIMVERYRGRG